MNNQNSNNMDSTERNRSTSNANEASTEKAPLTEANLKALQESLANKSATSNVGDPDAYCFVDEGHADQIFLG